MIELACQCAKCGSWGGLQTNNIHKATFKCKVCGQTRKIRYKKGWNLNVSKPKLEPLSDLVDRLNSLN